MLHRRTTLSAASRSENSYLRRGIEGGTVIPLRLSVINANGETDICSHCLRRNTDAMHRDVYKSMQPTRRSVWNYGKCKTLVFCQSSICLKQKKNWSQFIIKVITNMSQPYIKNIQEYIWAISSGKFFKKTDVSVIYEFIF